MSLRIESFADTADKSEFIRAFSTFGPEVVGLSQHYLETLLPLYIASGNMWVARIDGTVVGRLAGSRSTVDLRRGGLGLLALDEHHSRRREIGQLLIQVSLDWLVKLGVDQTFAPIDINTWFRFRLAEEDFRHPPPFSWEPGVQQLWQEILQKSGFSKAIHFKTAIFDTPDLSPALNVLGPHVRRAEAEGYTFRNFASDGDLDRDLRLTHQFSHACFQGSALFEPLEFSLYESSFGDIVRAGAKDTSFFISGPDGKELGFIFAFIENNYLVVKTIYVLPDFAREKARKWAASATLLHRAIQRGMELKVRGGVAAMMRDDATSNLLVRWQKWMEPIMRHYFLLAHDV